MYILQNPKDIVCRTHFLISRTDKWVIILNIDSDNKRKGKHP